MAPPRRIVIAGAGRMGQAIAARLSANPDLQLAGTWTRGADPGALVEQADAVIDFSLPDGTLAVVAACRQHAVPLVCGVTGLADEHEAAFDALAAEVPVVVDRNMSPGIALLDSLLAEAARSLGPDYAVEILETHHVHKKDAPSGTAVKLGETIDSARGPGAGAISYASERRGEVPGDHEVRFVTETENIVFRHSVTTRDVFADGAIRAARWVIGRAAGRYSMRDVLSAE